MYAHLLSDGSMKLFVNVAVIGALRIFVRSSQSPVHLLFHVLQDACSCSNLEIARLGK